MSEMTFGPRNNENYELALANRKLTTAILGMTLLTGLVACLSYLAGRTVTRIQTPQALAVQAAPVVVEPAPKITRPSPLAIAPVAPAPSAGVAYLQVGFVSSALAPGMQQKLAAKGYSVRVVPAETPNSSRLLIGPIQESDRPALQTKLHADGFQSFVRRF